MKSKKDKEKKKLEELKRKEREKKENLKRKVKNKGLKEQVSIVLLKFFFNIIFNI